MCILLLRNMVLGDLYVPLGLGHSCVQPFLCISVCNLVSSICVRTLVWAMYARNLVLAINVFKLIPGFLAGNLLLAISVCDIV